MRAFATIIVLGVAFGVRADTPKPAVPKPPVAVKGGYAFDWATKFPPPKCAKVAGALYAKLSRGFVCLPPDGTHGTASGRPLQAECTSKSSKSVYLVFTKLADCVEERAIQISNGAAG